MPATVQSSRPGPGAGAGAGAGNGSVSARTTASQRYPPRFTPYIAAAKAVAQLTLPALLLRVCSERKRIAARKLLAQEKFKAAICRRLQLELRKPARSAAALSSRIAKHTPRDQYKQAKVRACVCVHTAAVIITTLIHSNATLSTCRS